MRLPGMKQRGFALMIVLGLITLLVIYSITAETAVLGTQSVTRTQQRGLTRMRQRAALLETARAGKGLNVGDDAPAIIEAKQVPPDSPFWTQLSGVQPVQGDILVTLKWLEAPVTTETFLINSQGRRQGAIRLPFTPK